MAVGFESPNAGRRGVVASKGLMRHEGGYWGGRRFVGGDPVKRLAEPGAVTLPVGSTAEFPVPQEPKGADIFAAKQTGQAELSDLNYRRRDANNVVSGTIMKQEGLQINHRFCYRLRTFEG